jgi:hypothetical protein
MVFSLQDRRIDNFRTVAFRSAQARPVREAKGDNRDDSTRAFAEQEAVRQEEYINGGALTSGRGKHSIEGAAFPARDEAVPPINMRTRCLLPLILLLAAAMFRVPLAVAGAVVVENSTTGKLDIIARGPDGQQTRYTLAAGDVVPIAAAGPVGIAYRSRERRDREVPINSIARFTSREADVELTVTSFPASGTVERTVARPQPAALCTVPVKILSDDEEPRVQKVWERAIRRRLAAASDIFEQCCRVRFQVVAVGSWVSDPGIREFPQSLAEFERKVDAAPARLAIGFTGRYKWVPGEKHAGGTRAALASHILVREAFRQISEPARLELLVHELGHYLGAAHTPDTASVMRPVLGDRRSCARSFRIGFDASNTLAMYLIAEELRSHPLTRLSQLSPQVKWPLRSIYASQAKAMPDDTSALCNLAAMRLAQ